MPKPSELPGSEYSPSEKARIAVLGSLRLETPEATLESFGSRHAATILAILALHSEPVSRTRLATELWPGEDEEVMRPRLRQELFRLKKALGDWAHLVTADREFVALRRLCVSTDVEEFLSHVQAGRSVDGERRLELWMLAANIYKDDVLVDYDGEWLSHERSSLQGIRRRLLLNLIQLLIDRGRAPEAVTQARVLVRQDPLDEAAHCALAQAMHAAGDSSAAREHLRRVEGRLKTEGRTRGESLTRAWRVIDSPSPEPSIAMSDSVPQPVERKPILGRPLPVALHPMFGREGDIERILSQTTGETPDSPRLITIVGFGGMGKTRLAVEVARAISNLGKRLVGFVSLVEVDDPKVLVQNVAAAVRPTPEQSQDLFSTIASQLEGREATLVLDNFEDLVPQGVGIVERLLFENPGLRLLVTSRTPLGILGEQLYPLSPLAQPVPTDSESESVASPSVALFLDQTMRVRPDFVLDGDSLSSIVRLIGAVEGIPLAILLAACRMRTLSPQEAERAIRDRLSFLSGPRGGFEARHRTMRACIEWSCEALPPEVRQFWIKLANFHGGWTIEAAEHVFGESSALDYLEMLCDSSLVHREHIAGSTRYAMFEPVRQYADELLEPEDREAASASLASYFVDFLEKASATWFVGRRGGSFESVEAEMDNIRSSLTWSLTNNHAFAQRIGVVLRSFWSANGHHAEGRMWLDRILALPESSWLPRERMLMMLSAGIIIMDQADYGRSRALYLQARDICVEIGDEKGSAWIDLNMAHLDVLFGFVDRAVPVQRAALAQFEKSNHPSGIAHSMTDLGRSLVCLDDPQRAIELLQTALAIRLEVGWENGTAFAEAGLGGGMLKLGHLVQAYEHLDAARHICKRTKDARILVDVLSDLSECCLELGRLEESSSALTELRDLCRRIGDQLGSVYCDIRGATFELACGETCLALQIARQALDSALKLGIPLAILESLRVYAAISKRFGIHDLTVALVLGIEEVRSGLGIATWPRRTRELEQILVLSDPELDSAARELARSTAKAATLDTLATLALEVEMSDRSSISVL